MVTKISADSIRNVLDKASIVEEIGARIQLKKAGASYAGLCPFHGEKTPSFHVRPAHQRYHCFGCGASGDVIEFLMQHDGVDFPQAVEELAGRLGVQLDRDESPQSREQAREHRSEQETLATACAQAAHFFRDSLNQSETAKAYVQRRGLTPEVCETYQIGYAPPSTDALAAIFADYQSNAVILKAGLIGVIPDGPRQGQRYDRFRDRLMFPIRDTRGRLIGFGGRILQSNPKSPKYLNSPETPLFSKHQVLYGLHEARASIMREKQAFVVEGYMDVMAMAMHGLGNSVAAMGTALTEHHARLLMRFTKSVCFLFDGDKAGKTAAWKSAQTVLPMLAPGYNFTFLSLPDNLDPDEYLSLHGKDAFTRLLNEKALSLSEFIFHHLTDAHGKDGQLNTLEAKANFSREAQGLVELIPADNPLRQLMANEVARISGVCGPAPAAPRFQRPISSPFSRPLANQIQPTTLWTQLARCIELAPAQAYEHAPAITCLLNDQDPQELALLRAFDALESREHLDNPANVPADEKQAAIDLLQTATSLIKKKKELAYHQHIREQLDKGEISEIEYTQQLMEILGGLTKPQSPVT